VRRPTRRGLHQLATVVMLAAATAGIVIVNDLTQSPRSVGTPQVVGEEAPARTSAAARMAAPSWLMAMARSELVASGDTTPASAHWGQAPAASDVWDMQIAAESGTDPFYWAVFTGDFHAITAVPSGASRAGGHCLVVVFDPTDHSVEGLDLFASSPVEPADVGWLRNLDLTASAE